MSLFDELADIGNKARTLADTIFNFAVELQCFNAIVSQLAKELEISEAEQIRQRRVVSLLYAQMVKSLGQESFNPDSEKVTGRYRILFPDGRWREFDNMTSRGAEAIWREGWGLDQI